MFREKPIRPFIAFLSAGALAAALLLASAAVQAQSEQDRWQAAMDPADHAHMLGNLAEAEDHYLEALKLAERFDRTGGYLERSMAGLGGLYAAQNRFAEAAVLYRQALTIAEALYDTGNARHGVIGVYRSALAEAEAGRARQEAAARRAQEIAAARVKSPASPPPIRTQAEPAARPIPAPAPAPAPVSARGTLPPEPAIAPEPDLPPPPAPSAPVLSHYRLAGAVVPPPPPAEVLASIPASPPPTVPAKLPPAIAVTEASVPEAALSTAPSPSEPAVVSARSAPNARSFVPLRGTPISPSQASASPALPPAVEVADAAVPEAAVMTTTPPVDVPQTLAGTRLPEAAGLPLRGAPPPIARPNTVAPEEIAVIAEPPAIDVKTVPVVAEAETSSAETRSWNSRPVEIAGQPVDTAAIRALAADPAAPPELLVRAVAEETPEQIAQRKALEKRHPVLGVRLGAAKRNMGPIYPDTPRLADTEQAYLAELEALERSLGPDHPDVAAMLYKLARLYQRQSRYEPAGRMYERCLALREKTLPEGHPDIIETLTGYARLLRASGFSELGAAMRKRAEAEKAAAD